MRIARMDGFKKMNTIIVCGSIIFIHFPVFPFLVRESLHCGFQNVFKTFDVFHLIELFGWGPLARPSIRVRFSPGHPRPG